MQLYRWKLLSKEIGIITEVMMIHYGWIVRTKAYDLLNNECYSVSSFHISDPDHEEFPGYEEWENEQN